MRELAAVLSRRCGNSAFRFSSSGLRALGSMPSAKGCPGTVKGNDDRLKHGKERHPAVGA
jgi:hypothetical protein